MLPWVTDWSDPHNHLRFAPDVSKLSNEEWFWFHPINYKIVTYTPPIVTGMIFTCLGIVMAYYQLYLGTGISMIAVALMARDFYGKWKNRHIMKDTNMFDIYMREWVVGDKVK